MADNSNKGLLFDNENTVLIHSKGILLEDKKHSLEDIYKEYSALSHQYGQLLSEAQVITKVSDRLQNKLNSASEQVREINDHLEVKNKQLQETIDELTKARVGRKATTIVILIAVFLFIIAEAFIEPKIEAAVKNAILALFCKFAVFLVLLPVDFIVKTTLLKRAIKQANRASD
ncbi:MAG: hypothetical protein FVQ77_12295 [Cytophagales bacterium]|nr:hypothetical protein [Cytophagales bacterium]